MSRFGPGDTLLIQCVGCRQKFEWVVPTAWWDCVPHFHSKSCRKRASIRRRARWDRGDFKCPTPHKKVWSTQELAEREAATQSKGTGKLYSRYRCKCGGEHVGHIPHTVIRRVGSIHA